MKVLLSWLREFAPIEGQPEALGDRLGRDRREGRDREAPGP